MGIGSKLSRLMDTQKTNANELARKINVSPQTIYSIIKRDSRKADIEVLLKIADAFGVTAEYFVNEKETNNLSIADQYTYAERIYIKKYRFITEHSPEGAAIVDTVLNREHSIAEQLKEQKERIEELESENTPQRIIAYYQRLASAGSGDYLFDDIPTDFILVKSTAISRQADFVIGVNGRSMEDTYHDGDRVFVKKLTEIDRGDIGVFTRGNDCFIKELGTDRLISHNQDKEAYPDIPASNDIRLVGKVLGIVDD